MQCKFADVQFQGHRLPDSEHFVCERGNLGAENYIGILRSASRNSVLTASSILNCAWAGVEVTTVWQGKHPD